MCAPGAVFAPPTAGGGAVGGCLRFTSGGAGSIWKGGTFSELSGYALDQARILIDVQDGAHDVHLEDVAFNLVNTVATGQSCALVQVAGASSSSLLSGFQMARCRVRANSTREATSHSSGSILGWTAVRLQNALQAKVEGNTFWGGSTPNLSTGNLRCIYSALDSEFCSFRNNTGRGLLGLSDEQISGTDVIDAGASGLVEITNTSLEGHHSKFEGNNFEVCTASRTRA
jgi:hypothetical protein